MLCLCLSAPVVFGSAGEVKAYFNLFAPVAKVSIGQNKKTKEKMGFAYVEFASEAAASKVLQTRHIMHGREVGDCFI